MNWWLMSIDPGKINIRRNGVVVNASKNLAGILRYLRNESPARIVILIRNKVDGGGILQIRFTDGAHVSTEFADYNVLVGWVRGRRALRGVSVVEL